MVAYLLVTLGGGALVIVWIRWLWRRRSAPRWTLVALGIVTAALIAQGMSATSFGIVRYWGTGAYMDPHEALRIVVGTSIARVAVLLVLVILTWRHR